MQEANKGIYLVLITAVISGLAVFFNKFGLEAVAKDSAQYTTLKNGVVASILSLMIFTPFIWQKLKLLKQKDWLKLILIGLIGGSFPFLLFFKGLSLTSAVNAAFIHKTLFIWVGIMAWPILKEKITKLQIVALALLLAGVFIFDGLQEFSFGWAELMVLGATLIWTIESVLAKIILKKIDAIIVGWGRMFFGSLILIGFLIMTNNVSGLLSLNLSQVGWLFLASAFLTGYVVTWYSALKRLPATVVASFLVLAAPITMMLNSVFVTHSLATDKIVGALVILMGVLLFWNLQPKFKMQKLKINLTTD